MRRPDMHKRSPIAALTAVLLLSCACCKPPGMAAPGEHKRVKMNVETTTLERTSISENVVLPGIVEPELSVTVSSEVAAVVREVAVEEAAEVPAGEVLLRFDRADFEEIEKQAMLQVRSLEQRLKEIEKGARDEQIKEAESAVDAAKAGLDLAASSADRRRKLFEEKVLPQEALDQAEAMLKQARSGYDRAVEMLSLLRKGALEETKEALRAQIDAAKSAQAMAKTRLGKTEVRSPIAGVIQKRHIDPDEFAGPGQPLFEIIGKSPLHIVLGVPERLFTRMKEGDEARLFFKSLDATVSAKISRLGFAADRRSQTFEVRILIPNPVEAVTGNPGKAGSKVLIRPGLIAEITFDLGTRENAIAVPSDSVILDGLGVFVYVVREGKAVARPVKIGIKRDGFIEITDGLEAGEQLVTAGQKYIKDGDEVNVVARNSGAQAR